MAEAPSHVSREQLQRFFRSELSQQDIRDVLRHLFARCPRCLETALEVGREEGYTYADGEFLNTAGPPEIYSAVLDKVLPNADDVVSELARERLRGIGLWSALEGFSQERRLLTIRSTPSMHTWGLYERLLEKSREMVFRDPAEAVNLAYLALAVVEELDPARYGASRLSGFRAVGLATLGNAKRLASDFPGAETAFREARQALAQDTGDPLEEASLICLEASLLKDFGDFEEAAEHLDRAIAVYREIHDPHQEGRILLKQAATLGIVQPEKAVEITRTALSLIDPRREPRLELCGRHNLAWTLTDSGRPEEALAVLEASRPLYAQFRDSWTRIRLHWLEGKVARALGDLQEAEATLRRLSSELQDPVHAHELTLVSLDLAEVCVAQGKHDDALELVARFGPLLEGWGMHTQGLALWLLMQEAVRQRTAHTATFRHMAEYLQRAWNRPILPPGGLPEE
jgi:tetratricopeptide (TPR) repeat protein